MGTPILINYSCDTNKAMVYGEYIEGDKVIDRVAELICKQVFEYNDFNLRKTAKILDLDRRTIKKYMKLK